jgi:hypothetical protein
MPLALVVAGIARWSDGRSIVGFGEFQPGLMGFVRLLAPTPSGILYPQHYLLDGWEEPRLFDLIRVEAPWADRRLAQPETRIVDDTAWRLLERPASRPFQTRLDGRPPDAGPLLGGPGRAIRASGVSLPASIACIDPLDPLAVCEWDSARERYRTRLRFGHGGVAYDLPLTDERTAAALLRKGEGGYSLERLGCRAPHGLRLLITLSEPWHGWRYKLAAGILPLRTVARWRNAGSELDCGATWNGTAGDFDMPGAFVAGA